MSEASYVNRVFVGSCERMTKIPDGVVQTCVTSPPYYGLRDYATEGQIGLESTLDEYILRLVTVFREVRRTLRDDGVAWMVVGDSYAGPWGAQSRGAGDPNGTSTITGSPLSGRQIAAHPHGTRTGAIRAAGLKPKDLMGVPWALAFALRDDGWWLRDAIVWSKPNPMPSSVGDRCTPSYEMIFLLSKRPSYFFDQDAIREPLASATLERITQKKWLDGTQVGSDRANGGAKSNGPMRAVVRNPSKGFNTGERLDGGVAITGNAQTSAGLHRNGGGVYAETGANKRNVWTIPTTPYSDAHFATFPLELPSLCIRAGSSEFGCCAECGASRVRTTTVSYDTQGRTTNGPRSVENRAFSPGVEVRAVKSVTTTGSKPSCGCDAPTKPCLVLDPFMGSGTTAEAAAALGRHFTGYEINESYHALISERTRQAGLFSA